MSVDRLPEHYVFERCEHRAVLEAVENLGKVVRQSSPIDEKHTHLIQLAAAVSINSEGALTAIRGVRLHAAQRPTKFITALFY